MPQSLAKNLVHLTFSTAQRQRFIVAELRSELAAYIASVLKAMDSPAVEVNVEADHVHILFSLSRKHALAKVVERVKTSSSKWIKTRWPEAEEFHWQGGYGAFSVSQSNVAAVRKYIQRQEEHHRKATFEEEFRALLARHQIEFDERYLWD